MTADRLEGARLEAPRRRTRSRILLAVLVLAVMAALLSLGTWQVQRLFWKESLLDTIETRIAAAPESLAAVEEEWRESGDVEYVPVRAEGTFLNDAEQHFLATYRGLSGWYVYVPLILDDGRALIVNRGFIPYDRKDAARRDWQEPEGTVSFTGLARNPLYEKPGWIVPDNAPAANLWYWKDYPAMREAMGLTEERTLGFFVDVGAYDGEANPFPVPGVTQVDLPNNHLQYAVTWYGLAAALAGVAGFMFFRRPKADHPEKDGTSRE